MAGMRPSVNLWIGLVLIGIVSLPTYGLLSGEFRHSVFSQGNAWFAIALLCLQTAGIVVAVIGLKRGLPFGYPAWSQTVLSFLVLVTYIGWHRRELDYAQAPATFEQGPPEATAYGLGIVLLIWAGAALLPLAIRHLVKRAFKR